MKTLAAILALCLMILGMPARADDLATGFANPPHEARPGVYWWWLNSSATRESITRDLEELKAKGDVRLNLFDAGSSSYNGMERTPPGPVFGSKEWTDRFVYMLREADRLGIEVTMNICSGWNPGGPSVKVEDAMKHLVWTEARASGPSRFSEILAQPAGDGYRDVLVQAFKLKVSGAPDSGGNAGGLGMPAPRITASSAQPNHLAPSILDHEPGSMWVSQDGPAPGKPQWIQLEFSRPVAANQFYVEGRKGYSPREFELQLSNDGGKTFETAGKFTLKDGQAGEFTIWAVKARVFRLSIITGYDRGRPSPQARNVQVTAFGIGPRPADGSTSGITRWKEKALIGGERGGVGVDVSFLAQRESADPATAEVELGDSPRAGQPSGKSTGVVDLTAKMGADGKLDWDVPEGEWVIVRYGHAHLPSAKVSTASEGWGGYSFDHLDDAAVKKYLNDVVEPVLKAAGPLAGRSLKYLYTDSWEMGTPNWTRDFIDQFKARRGYDPAPWLPAMTGRVVGSRDLTNRFLYDFRQTIGDLIADRFYKTFGDYARAHGLEIHCEAGGPHGHPVDALRCLGRQAFMQGEFWPRCLTHRITETQRYFVKQPASAAHIYGKTWIAAEGPTTVGPHWERPPRDLKDAFDKVFCEGLNRLYWHTFTSSPAEFGVPGNEYFAGTHLNPNATWWEQAPAFLDYISRCSFMLSRGLFVADAAVFVGEDVPVFGTQKHEVEGLGPGFDYDDVNTEAILTRMSVKDGMITLPDGMQYRLLILPERDAMSAALIRKLAELVRAGATIVGPRPATSTGLAGYPESEAEVKRLAAELWGGIDGKNVTVNRCGKGRVVWGKTPREVLAGDGIGPDFAFRSALPDTWLDTIHRRAGDVDIYYVINRLAVHGINDTQYRYTTTLPDRYERIDAAFRVSGAAPELWDPVTGRMTPLGAWREGNGVTTVPLHLTPYGSAFVVFRKGGAPGSVAEIKKDGGAIFPLAPVARASSPAGKPGEWPEIVLERRDGKTMAASFSAGNFEFKSAAGQAARMRAEAPFIKELAGAWEVSFDPKWGGPASIRFDKLDDWTQSKIEGIKYYSGAATYKKSFDIPQSAIRNPQSAIWLDLGNVLELAEVKLNGKSLGVAWMPPYRLDVSDAVKAGANELEVKVVNLWPNRLIGDAALPPEKRLTKTNVRKFTPDTPLRPSGLLGPVKLIAAPRVEIGF